MKFTSILVFLFIISDCWTQVVPSVEENIPYLVTFGNEADKKYGDDDYSQVFFFSIPKDYSKPFYIRVYDPDVGGEIDEKVGGFNTTTKFAVYGGKGTISVKDARSTDPKGNYDSGNLMAMKKFNSSPEYDEKWYAFGPFDPKAGEYSEQYNGYVFKIIASGISGDDGNLYKYALSTSKDKNISVEGANSFTFEYTFRLDESEEQTGHIYPYISDKVTAIELSNFDWDDDGTIEIYSTAVIGRKMKTSSQGNWVRSKYTIKKAEKGSSLDIRLIKKLNSTQNHNNVVLYVTNQYGEHLPFYSAPIGGIPKFKVDIDVRITD